MHAGRVRREWSYAPTEAAATLLGARRVLLRRVARRRRGVAPSAVPPGAVRQERPHDAPRAVRDRDGHAAYG